MRRGTLILLAVSLAAIGQDADWATRIQARAAQAKEIAARLRPTIEEDQARYTAEYRGRLTSEFDRILKDQVLDTLAETDGDRAAVRRALRLLGPSAQPDMPETGSVADALPFTLLGSKVVITTFLLAHGPTAARETKVFIQAYRRVGSMWEFADETGGDLNNHGLYVQPLHSPRKEQVSVLAHGAEAGLQPRRTRFRVYSFDGLRFATEWSPADCLNGAIGASDTELAMSCADDTQPARPSGVFPTIHRRFMLTASGIIEAPVLPRAETLP